MYIYIRQELLHAFSHFSYETSEHKLVVADMQHLSGETFSDPWKALARLRLCEDSIQACEALVRLYSGSEAVSLSSRGSLS